MFTIKGLKINQFGDESTYLTKFTYGKLKKIIRYSNRDINPYDPIDEKKEYIKKSDESLFQRNWSEKRLKEISSFIDENYNKTSEEKIPLFPTPIIISIDRDFEYEKNIKNIPDIDGNYLVDKAIIVNEQICIPESEKIALVVDGQHRLKGIEKYIKDSGNNLINNMELSIIFILGLDLYRLSEVFVNINFEQKRVNKSLYYDIFGALPNSKEIKFTHELALHLNNNGKSPLFNKINLLGVGDGFFSQALFVDLISRYFRLRGMWREHYEDFISGGDKDKYIAQFMSSYFNSIKKAWSKYWKEDNIQTDYKYILCRPTGMGALFRLIKDIYKEVESLEKSKLETKFTEILKRISEEDLDKIFDKNGDFAKSGSYGLQTKLYKLLKEKLKLNQE